MSDTASPPAPGPGVHARRVIFIDLARAMAVVMMMYGHTVSALLDKRYQTGTWFDVWTFQRGLTSSLFLFLSGFAFSIATMRHWAVHTHVSPAVRKRAQRFALFILLGYALHFPVRHVADLATVDDQRWQAFLAVDVLQLVGVTLLSLQLLVLLSRSRRVFIAVAFALAAFLIGVAPTVWAMDLRTYGPPTLAAYLSPSTGSLFPLIPWSAYVLAGASVGGVYARWGAAHLHRFANLMLLAPGAVLVLVGLQGDRLPFVSPGPFAWAPAMVLLRIGVCMIVLAVVAHASRRITRMPHVFGAVAQESLVVYVVHLCIVYGSIWNIGLYQVYPTALSPVVTVAVVLALIASMTLLAWQWNRLKHHRPRVARWVTVGTGVTLAAFLA